MYTILLNDKILFLAVKNPVNIKVLSVDGDECLFILESFNMAFMPDILVDTLCLHQPTLAIKQDEILIYEFRYCSLGTSQDFGEMYFMFTDELNTPRHTDELWKCHTPIRAELATSDNPPHRFLETHCHFV